jgi:hypothetical protein
MKLVVRAAKWIFFHPIFSHQFFCPDRHVFDRNINDRNIAVSRKAAAALNSMRFAVAPLINATLATRMSSASQSNEHRDKLKAAIATSSLFGTQAFSLGYRVWDFQSQLRDCADSGKSTWQAARYLARVKCMSTSAAILLWFSMVAITVWMILSMLHRTGAIGLPRIIRHGLVRGAPGNRGGCLLVRCRHAAAARVVIDVSANPLGWRGINDFGKRGSRVRDIPANG